PFHHRVRGRWWETLAAAEITLLVTREYEHIVIALRCLDRTGPEITFLPMPHPSGLVADRQRGIVHVASTRNPNQVYVLAPVTTALDRPDVALSDISPGPLVPVRSRFYPVALYLHDLAMIGRNLYANA